MSIITTNFRDLGKRLNQNAAANDADLNLNLQKMYEGELTFAENDR